MSSIGYQWLSETYHVVPVQPFAVRSEIGRIRSTATDGDTRHEIYTESYRPGPMLRDHLTFALKYEGIHLEFLARLFQLPAVRNYLEAWIAEESTGAYARRACFFYEWLTAEPLSAPGVTRGNYVDALDSDEFFVGAPVNNTRWRVRDNMPGSRDFCPVIQRLADVKAAEQYDLTGKLAGLEADFGVDLLMRSTVWLTVKESRASFLIEREQDQEDRIRRFAAVMETETGRHDNPFELDTLVTLQHGILGGAALRYGLRRSPVYVGHTAAYQPVVDYIAPHWKDTASMLAGLATFLDRTRGGSPIIRAATASFGFVYIHPMADGNGRISRFLINDILRRDGVVPAPVILPVSATITNSTHNRAAYDKVLERFSRPLMRHYADQYYFGETAVAGDGVQYNLYFNGYDDALPAWRYPDLSAHVGYLAGVIDATLMHEMRVEARFLRANDRARQAIKTFLEAPNHDLDSIIHNVQQNGYAISNQLHKRYPILAEKPELGEQIVQAVMEAFRE
ncbi:MAG: Fic family protein [Gammaproteobacteria bacterium]|nr:Fic family protein [Gammaproteobacteria bacterium]